jgi:hypothetical protein
MKTIISRNLLESIGMLVPGDFEGVVVNSEGPIATGISWLCLPHTISEYLEIEDSARKTYGDLLRVADFYRSLEGGIEIRNYGLNFGSLDSSDDLWKRDGKLCDPDFAFSYPETRDAFYHNFREDLIKVSSFIKKQYK